MWKSIVGLFEKNYLLIQSMSKKIFGIDNNKVLLIQLERMQKHKKIHKNPDQM